MKPLFLSVLIVFVTSLVFAQDDSFDWKHIPEADLKMKTYAADEEADAIILGQETIAKYDVAGNYDIMSYRTRIRMKILTEAGIDKTNIQIPFYHDKKYETVSEIKGRVVTLKNGEVVSTKLKKEDIFTEKGNEYWSAKRIAFPAVEVGSVIEYSYVFTSKSVLSVKDYYFQREIPVRWATFKFQVPDFFTYAIITQKPYEFHAIDTQAIKFELIRYDRVFNGAEYSWTVIDLPAVKEEAFVTTINDYLQRIRIQLYSVQYPGQSEKFYFTTWKDAKKKLMDNKNFGKRFTSRSSIKKLREQCGAVNDRNLKEAEKVKEIYTFVQQNMEWNGGNSMYVDERFDDSFEKQKGAAADINLMLLALLREAGIEAYPVLVSTRDNGRPNMRYPLLEQFNYVLVNAIIDEKSILLDAVDPLLPMGMVSEQCLNLKGWSLKGVEGEWINIIPKSQKQISQILIKLDDEGSAKGYIKSLYDGYAALASRVDYFSSNKEDYIAERIETDIVGFEIDSFSFKNEDAIDKKFHENIYFSVSEMADIGGDMIYLNPFLNEGWDENPLKMQNRTYPIDLGYPLYEKILINIKLPEGYTIEEVPEDVRIVLENGGSFIFMSSVLASGELQIMSFLDLKRPIYKSDEYEYIKKFFDMVIEKHSAQVVLKKVE